MAISVLILSNDKLFAGSIFIFEEEASVEKVLSDQYSYEYANTQISPIISVTTYLVSSRIRSCAKKQGDESRCGEYRRLVRFPLPVYLSSLHPLWQSWSHGQKLLVHVVLGATTTTEQQEESSARRQRPRSHSCPLLTTVLSSGSAYQTSFSPLGCCQGHLLLQHTSLKRCGEQETIFHAQRTVLYLP